MDIRRYFNYSPALMAVIGINIGIAVIVVLVDLAAPDIAGEVKRNLVVAADWSDFLRHPWTAVTYMFTQFSFLHLLFNMLWVLWFGKIFLLCSSEKHLLISYIGGGLAGALLFLIVCNISPSVPGSFLIGSSAAVLSVMTAAALMAPNLELNMLLLGRVRLKYVALLCIVLTFAGIGGGSAGGFSAHIGGILFGIFLPSFSSYSSLSSLSRGSSSEAIFEKWRSRLRSIFKRKKPKRVPEAFKTGKISVRIPTPQEDEARLDELLDKVRISGYDSLSTSEKQELNSISNRL